ncbi:phage terminase large subunit [Azospirillum sp.]|uniref:phage terminase large subunit n=1 Tax=Azospirillum sp. TaxID=34012 RepID=UPI002D5148E2|nr:phage terminase large subunit [Azospirillum sp.]HYD69896.1 phage terminase large subunit [Azospirillum sp.]
MTPEDNADVSFRDFVDAWNRQQQQTTPFHHHGIGAWLNCFLDRGQRHLLLMAFRGAGKSTLVGLFAAWLLCRDPNRRLLVLAADLRLAKKMVRNVKRIIERHPMTRGLKPKERDQWAADQFTVVRRLELRDPSMLAAGVDGNVTGNRADVVICDDVEVPRTADTALKRETLREVLREVDFLLVPGGVQLYVGTPHSHYTIYADDAHADAGESRPFLDGFRRLVLPVVDKDRSAWPERFPLEHVERIRRRSGPNKFASQMLLQPVPASASRLDPDDLRPYRHELVYHEGQGQAMLTLNGVRLMSATAWWDPSCAAPDEDGRPPGDDSVVAAVFTDAAGNHHLHRVLYLRIDRNDPTQRAVQQCRAVTAFVRDLNLPGIYVEQNGLGRFLPEQLRAEMRRAGVAASVIGVTSTKPKAKRILEGFDARLAAGRLHAHVSLWDTPFIREMREWRPQGRSGVRDDALDAVAGCLLAEPIRFEHPPPPARPTDWRPGAVVGAVVAGAEWDV